MPSATSGDAAVPAASAMSSGSSGQPEPELASTSPVEPAARPSRRGTRRRGARPVPSATQRTESVSHRRCRGLERVETGVGERADDADLLDRRPVDLLDLADHELEQSEAVERDRELVDRDVGPALEHVDADDVAADRTDPGRDETERTRTVGEPHAHEHAGRRVGVAALATVTLGSHTLSGHDQKRRSAEYPRVSS